MNRLVAFVTDQGYLVPTLVAARQLSRSPAAQHCDITVYLTDIPAQTVLQLRDSLQDVAIRLEVLDSSAFGARDGVKFHPSHISWAALGRLVIGDYIPDQYEHVVYLDGDVQILADISALILHDVAPGKIAAASEWFWLAEAAGDAAAEDNAAYLAGLGISSGRDYFNSGVLAFRLDTWREHAPRALQFFMEHSELCKFHDQSALNAIFLGRREVLSPAFNYTSEYALRGLGKNMPPRIAHFTGGTKPWRDALFPWGRRYMQPYIDFLRDYPALQTLMPLPSPLPRHREFAQNAKRLYWFRQKFQGYARQRKAFAAFLDEESLVPHG